MFTIIHLLIAFGFLTFFILYNFINYEDTMDILFKSAAALFWEATVLYVIYRYVTQRIAK